MNLRIEEAVRDTRKRYCYFVYYMSEVGSSTGEGMTEVTLHGRKITSMKEIRDVANYILESNNKNGNTNGKWKKVIIRNFILLREEGGEDGPKPREEETSTEDDSKVPEGSQGRGAEEDQDRLPLGGRILRKD